jgi:hypothetical protein
MAIPQGYGKPDGSTIESIMITGVIKTKEERDIMTCNIPNAFIQVLLPK